MATRLMTEDELDFNADSLFPFGESTQSLPTGSPEWFKNYIYSGGLNDAEATKRGIEWVVSQGMRPQDAVNLWNKALGTSFNVSDLFSRTGSGPEFTNFGQEGSWQTGANAVNDAQTGMIRSADSYFQRGNEAVVSDELFWNPNSPTGAALAAKIQNARQQGQRPGIVITPYAVFQGKATNEQLLDEVKNSGADFVALDPYLGWGVSADDLFEWTKNFIPQLNALGKEVKLVTQGFARKGEEEAVKAYNDRLLSLTGISEVVNFGLEDWFPEGSEEAKQLFSASSEWTPLDNDYKPPEKKTVEGTGTTIGEPATPAAIEQQATMQTPQSAANVGEPMSQAAAVPSQPQQFSGLFGGGGDLASQAQQVLAASGKANDPRFADAIVGTFTKDGVIYNVQGDGSIQGIIETPTGAYLAGGFTPTGQQATEQLSTRFEETDLDRVLGILANAAIAAGTGFALGPAGVGALGVPGAAAAGAGITNFANTGDLQQALRAAALGGLTAYGVQSLFPGAGATAPVDDFLAADVAQLAAQGIPEEQIAQILTQEGVAANVINAALDAQFGTSAPGSARGLGTPSTPSGAEQVAITGQNVSNLGALSSLAPALAAFVPSQTLPSIQVTGQTIKPDLTVPSAVSAALPAVLGGTVQQVGITGQTIPKTEPVAPSAAAVGSIIPGIQAAVPSAAEQVQVTGKKETPTTIDASGLGATLPTIPASIAAALPAVLGGNIQQAIVEGTKITKQPSESMAAATGAIIPSITAAVPSAADQVQVTGKKETPTTIDVSGLGAALPAIPAAVKATLPEPIKPPAKKEDSLFTPSDILKLLTLLGGTAAVGGAGTGIAPVGSIPPSDRMIGSTTPQFGPDYYAAVQRYYNAYMPETPRNVAGPLQQWYENKYGA